MLSRLPGAEVLFVAAEPGPKRTDTGALALTAERGLGEVPQPEIVVVPGGRGTRDQPHDELVGWIQQAHQTSRYTTSVCTGALLLGAAGVLEGLHATTWRRRSSSRSSTTRNLHSTPDRPTRLPNRLSSSSDSLVRAQGDLAWSDLAAPAAIRSD